MFGWCVFVGEAEVGAGGLLVFKLGLLVPMKSFEELNATEREVLVE